MDPFNFDQEGDSEYGDWGDYDVYENSGDYPSQPTDNGKLLSGLVLLSHEKDDLILNLFSS